MKNLDCKELFLTHSFRFGSRIADMANRLLRIMTNKDVLTQPVVGRNGNGTVLSSNVHRCALVRLDHEVSVWEEKRMEWKESDLVNVPGEELDTTAVLNDSQGSKESSSSSSSSQDVKKVSKGKGKRRDTFYAEDEGENNDFESDSDDDFDMGEIDGDMMTMDAGNPPDSDENRSLLSLKYAYPNAVFVICRTNQGVFNEAVKLMETHKVVFFGDSIYRNFHKRIDKMHDLVKILDGVKGSFMDAELKDMDNIDDVLKYAESMEDKELVKSVKDVKLFGAARTREIVSRAQRMFPKKRRYTNYLNAEAQSSSTVSSVHQAEQVISMQQNRDNKPVVLLSTTHQVKGLEFDHVRISSDFIAIGTLLRSKKALLAHHQAELNLLYGSWTLECCGMIE
eukprot:TRINITY_DN626_c0_g1_i1.p2 TRINITY_DN626_c0_g1~~TRINITY_DN626_c0_g1_i1.p2  ORF type:complete len:395 (-),score=137.27 TRINITY_DN626_c0_g1_i1:791-1975(-)